MISIEEKSILNSALAEYFNHPKRSLERKNMVISTLMVLRPLNKMWDMTKVRLYFCNHKNDFASIDKNYKHSNTTQQYNYKMFGSNKICDGYKLTRNKITGQNIIYRCESCKNVICHVDIDSGISIINGSHNQDCKKCHEIYSKEQYSFLMICYDFVTKLAETTSFGPNKIFKSLLTHINIEMPQTHHLTTTLSLKMIRNWINDIRIINNNKNCLLNNTVYYPQLENSTHQKEEKYCCYECIHPKFFILGSEKQLYEVKNTSILIIDGTFYTCPQDYDQVLNIMIRLNDTKSFICIMHIVMSGKDQNIYCIVLHAAAAILKLSAIQLIICDFELALINAIKSVFKDVPVKGCYFHYTQCIKRYFKKQKFPINGLYVLLKKIIQNLPFLPIEMQNEFWRKIEPYSRLFEKIIHYFTKQFEIRYGNGFWSYNDKDGDVHTQSALEGYHKRMKKLFPDGPGPNVTLFTRQIFRMDQDDLSEVKYLRLNLKEIHQKSKLTCEERKSNCLRNMENLFQLLSNN